MERPVFKSSPFLNLGSRTVSPKLPLSTELTRADQKGVDFIQKWIFPGGFLPTVSYVVDSIRVGSKSRLVVDSISNIGVSLCHFTECVYADLQPHYARTLREWRRRFLANFNDLIAPALRSEHPEMTDADIEVFKRKWLCEIWTPLHNGGD